ncbi:MAG: hypothetical protein GX620_07350 [Chloroflexi bacterium]|nr:hypothetical protein [Chloroflexota bacterium]
MTSSGGLFRRMLRAMQLQAPFYEEIEADTAATPQALLVVVLVALATGIGTGLDALLAGGAGRFLYGLLYGVGAAIVGWLLWALFAYVFGVSILKGPQTSSTWGELLRTMGFANSPGVLRIFAFIPGVGTVLTVAASIWSLAATIIAIRQALDFSTWRAIITALIGWIAYMVLLLLMMSFAGGSTPVYF